MMLRTIATLALVAALSACKGEQGPAGAPGAPGASPTAPEVARSLAQEPEFVRAVARAVAAQTVTAPVGDGGVPVDAAPHSRLLVTIDSHGGVGIEGRTLPEADFTREVRARIAADPEVRVLIAADRTVQQQRTISVIDLLRGLGVRHFAMAAAPAH